MIPRTYAQAKAEKQKSTARKISRAAKRKELWAGKPGFDKRGKPWTISKARHSTRWSAQSHAPSGTMIYTNRRA